MSNRSGPMNRMGTPVNGNMFPPRGESRMRRPSEAGSLRGGPPPPMDPYSIPPSPNLPNGDYARPMPRQPTQNNTIVPNKSTMIEEDDEGGEAFVPEERAINQENKRMSTMTSETDKKMIEEYQTQVRELREKLDSMEDAMRKKEEEMNTALNSERSRATAAASEKLELVDVRSNLEGRLTEVQNLNNSLKQELERMREDHDLETSELREQVEQSAGRMSSDSVDEELKRENEKLRYSLQQQQRVTEEVRSEAQEFLREMRVLSQQSGSTYEKQVEMEKTIEQLEREVREWRNRYARTKTQLRNVKGSSVGLTMDDAAKYIRDRGFLEDSGLVKDVHVTKFQIAIDELLQKVRQETPEEVIDAMKSVVVSVRRITRDIDESTPHGSDPNQRGKLRAKVSATANSLITASKNFASSAGLAPVSLIDAAASHLTVAIVDLLRVVKIRPTPVVELEDEDDQSVTPVDSTGFFSPAVPPRNPLVMISYPHPRPVSSPRASVDAYAKDTGAGMADEVVYMTLDHGVPGNSNGYGMQQPDDNRLEDLKIYLEDQNALLVSDIQNLVNCVRSEANIAQISTEIDSISVIVGKMISETQSCGHADMVARVTDSRNRLLDANHHGQEMAASNIRSGDGEWRTWTQTLPPMAFEIARESKDLVQRVGRLTTSREADDFS
ncbi:hypothetical protein PT974_06147 [Cladobotryum mycophilum]|uniref:C3G9 VBS-like domain-containing protein n=1 Tax=Cladobotryum mycophilum TaxID=491253 RepID=A0ABR0SLN6_9HYPO